MHQRDKWFFAFGGVPAEQIKEVDVFDETNADYVPVGGEALADLTCDITQEMKKFRLDRLSNGRTAIVIADGDNSWLLDGPRLKREREAKRQQEARRQVHRNRQERLERQRKQQRKQKAKQKKRCQR